MREAATFQRLPDGRRAHLRHGPIDIVLEAFGPSDCVDAAYALGFARMRTVLGELCAELPLLRSAAGPALPVPAGRTARRMHAAVKPYAGQCFITPMAAVAGAVAEEVLEAMASVPELARIYVNNGGDIALHLAPDQSLELGIVDIPEAPRLAGTARIAASSPVRGVATSGWRGRSFSLGIADAVTILAASASAADAAATIIANAVDLPGHPAVAREPAARRRPDSDLGERLVTLGVGRLTGTEIEAALERGRDCALRLLEQGRISAAALFLGGHAATVGLPRSMFRMIAHPAGSPPGPATGDPYAKRYA